MRDSSLPGLPPGPRIPRIMQGVALFARLVPFLERCRTEYGKRFTIRFPGAPPWVMLTAPEDVKDVFTSSPQVFRAGSSAGVLQPLVGANSILLVDEQRHVDQRRLMLPAFNHDRVNALSKMMADVAEREVALWPRGETVALLPRLQAVALEIVIRALFGPSDEERLDALHRAVSEMVTFLDSFSWMVSATVINRVPHPRFNHLRRRVDATVSTLIDEGRRGTSSSGEHSMVDALLEARHEDGSRMSENELLDEVRTLLWTGHEAVASSLAWAFERLARNPRTLGRLVREIQCDDSDAFLTATVQETLRSRPVLPFHAPRVSTQPVEVGGWRYPAGVGLVATTYLLHHDHNVYPDPYAFQPQRFLTTGPGKYTWIPFAAGERRCLGSSFAMMEIKTVLRAVLLRYELAPVGQRQERARRRLTQVTPRDGVLVVLRDRRLNGE